MLIELVVGDWSGDGHNLTESYNYEVNSSMKELGKAYKLGVKKCGVDISKFCKDFEDGSIPRQVYNKIAKAGYDPELSNDDDDISIDPSLFADIYMFICSLGNPELKYTSVNLDSINIGGYGCFHM